MILSALDFGLIFGSSLLLCGLLTPLMRNIAIARSILDSPNQVHKTHGLPIPYLGGIAIILTVLVIIFLSLSFVELDSSSRQSIFAILIPATMMGLVGLVDDLYNLKPFPRFIAQTAAGTFTAISIISSNTVGSPTGIDSLDFAITVFWIVGITNSINFFDNHDGGAAGTVLISSLGLFFLSLISGQNYLAAISILLGGALLGFLFWNRSPAQIYMGDAGALFLGTLISALLVRFEPNPISRSASFAIPILLLAVPILDTCVAIFSRVKGKRSPFQGGQDHLSHRLMRKLHSKKQVALILWVLSAIFVVLATLISSVSWNLEEPILLFSAALWIVLFILFMKLG